MTDKTKYVTLNIRKTDKEILKRVAEERGTTMGALISVLIRSLETTPSHP